MVGGGGGGGGGLSSSLSKLPNCAVLLIFFFGGGGGVSCGTLFIVCLYWISYCVFLPKVQEKSSLLTFTRDNMVCRHKS